MNPRAGFTRTPPSGALRYGIGLAIYGFVRPAVWALEQLGLASRVMEANAGFQQRWLARTDPFAGYAPTAHDVFVATYPKSGTNWMMQIAHQLLYHGNGEYEHIHSVVPWPDAARMGLGGYAIPLGDPSVWQASPEQKRVIKTHLTWDAIPYSPRARYVIVIRDPKDIFVSSYFFFLESFSLTGIVSIETWFKVFLSEKASLWGTWPVSTAGYWAERHRPNVLIVSFRSMKQDLEGAVRRLAGFLDVGASNAVIGRVLEKASFDYMKRLEAKFGMWRMNPWGPDSVMIRKGVQGGSSELLSLDQQVQIDTHFMAELKRLGSDFPYDEFCEVARNRPAN